MVICELCGSANVEMDEQCRVCGQALRKEAAVQPMVAAQVAMPPAPESAPAPPPAEAMPGSNRASAEGAGPADPAGRSLQMSAVDARVDYVAPPMLGGNAEAEAPPVDAAADVYLPGFMQPGNRAANPAPEPVQLISANDLPEWLRQIAEADAAKVEAEAQMAPAHSDAPATIVKRALPGETIAAAPTTTWLAKSGQTSDSPDHWDSSEVANANWGNLEPTGAPQQSQEYPSIIPPTAFVPSVNDSYASTKPKKRFSLSSSSSSGKPFYRNQTIQLAALVAMVAILALLLLS